MRKKAFNNLLTDLERRIHEEGKTNPSWLMGYLQGRGKRNLTGYQCAVLIDLLLVPLEELGNGTKNVKAAPDPEQVQVKENIKKEGPEEKKLVASPETSNNLLKALSQR